MRKVVLLFTVLLLISCHKSKISHLIGEWNQETYNSLAPGNIVYSYSFKLFCDQTFYMARKVNRGSPSNDVCKSIVYYEYAKGKFDVKKGKFVLNGTFTDSLYIDKTSGCYSIGRYSETFNYRFENDKLIINDSNDDSDIDYVLKRTWDYECK